MARSSVLLMGILVFCFCAAMAKTDYIKYKDPKQSVNVRIKDLMSRMTLEEKIGQMVQIDRIVASNKVMKKYLIGSILSGGWSVPAEKASPETWVDMVNDFQKGSLSTRLGIPMIYGIDVVHGHNNVYGATIFPHDVGLGATSLFRSCSPGWLLSTDDRGLSCRPIVKDSPIKSGRLVKVMLDWTEKDHELYDASYFKDLPEVHKTGPTVVILLLASWISLLISH